MRLDSVSVAKNGIASVSTVAPRGDRRKHHGEKVRIEPLDELLHHGLSQKSKLIILRITSTPIPIQMAQPANIACPSGSVNRIEM